MYKKPMIFFGMVIPLVISASIVGIGFKLREKVDIIYEERAKQYKAYQMSKMKAFEVEGQLVRHKDVFEQWMKVLEQDSFSLLNTNMKMLAGKYPSKEFQQPIPERMPNKIGFGTVSAQNSKALKFNLRGTYRTTQKALLELETRMPNLQLQDLRIDPNTTTNASIVNIQVTYTAWEK